MSYWYYMIFLIISCSLCCIITWVWTATLTDLQYSRSWILSFHFVSSKCLQIMAYFVHPLFLWPAFWSSCWFVLDCRPIFIRFISSHCVSKPLNSLYLHVACYIRYLGDYFYFHVFLSTLSICCVFECWTTYFFNTFYFITFYSQIL